MYVKVMATLGLAVLAVFVAFFALLVVDTVYPREEAQRVYTYDPDEYWGGGEEWGSGGDSITFSSDGMQSYYADLSISADPDEPSECLEITADRLSDGKYLMHLETECEDSEPDLVVPDIPDEPEIPSPDGYRRR